MDERAVDGMRHLDLFSGIGGFALAAHWAGFETVAFCEIEAYAQAVLRKHWPGKPIFDDINTLTIRSLQSAGIDGIDLITGGFPCQDISAAGAGAGITGSRSGLWFEMLRIIHECLPAWVVIENSPVLRIRGADIVLKGLEGLDYACWPLVVGADDAGAPHLRKRAVIVAHRNGERCAPGAERSGRAEGANADRSGPGTAVDEWPMGNVEGGGFRRGVSSGECRQTACTDQGMADADQTGRIERRRAFADGTQLTPFECSGEGVANTHMPERREGDTRVGDVQRSGDVRVHAGRQEGSGRLEPCGQELADTAGDGGREDSGTVGGGKSPIIRATEANRDSGRSAGSDGVPCGVSEEPRAGSVGAAKPGLGGGAHGLPGRLDQPLWPSTPGQEQNTYEPPRTGTKIPNRAARLKGLGNAVVPQVVYPILQAIADIEREQTA